MEESRKSQHSQATSFREMGLFWDEHDFTDFDTDAPDVVFDVSSAIAIEPELLTDLETQADNRGVGVETLINLWLKEKLIEQVYLKAA